MPDGASGGRTDTPLVSVIVPCYNLGEYLDETIQSVLAQTLQDFEILVVDDGSTDAATTSLLASASWPKTRVYRTENRGLARARNFLIAQARGRYLCALDADDTLHADYLRITSDVLERRPDLTFASPHLQMFGAETHRWPNTDKCDLATLLAEDTVITAALVRRDAVLGVGGYDEQMPAQGNEDWDLWISLVEAGHIGVILPEVLFYYRRRRGSMCDVCTSGETHATLVAYLIEKHRQSYASHLFAVLKAKESEISAIRRANIQLESELACDIEPMLALRRAEVATLTRKLEIAKRRQADQHQAAQADRLAQELGEHTLEAGAWREELERSRAEVAALRRSASWAMTAPVRALYDGMLRLFGRRGPS